MIKMILATIAIIMAGISFLIPFSIQVLIVFIFGISLIAATKFYWDYKGGPGIIIYASMALIAIVAGLLVGDLIGLMF